jgi:hypothetical protein
VSISGDVESCLDWRSRRFCAVCGVEVKPEAAMLLIASESSVLNSSAKENLPAEVSIRGCNAVNSLWIISFELKCKGKFTSRS